MTMARAWTWMVCGLLTVGTGCGGAAGGPDAGSPVQDAGSGDAGSGEAGPDAAAADADASDAGASDAGASDAGADGATSADAAGDVGSILPGLDAGAPFGDAGALGEPPWVPIEVRTSGTCPALAACGGDVVGTWDVAGGCVELPIGDTVAMCPGAAITRADGQARGRVTFDGALAHRVAQSIVDVQITVPGICASFVGGCSAIETQLRARTPDAACTTGTSGACTCEARETSSIDDTDAYTTSAGEIVGTGSGKRWAYCIDGESLSYEDRSASGPREPGILRLMRR